MATVADFKANKNIMTRSTRCADYNAFGYDPYGFNAHVAALMYGPQWKPTYTVQQFVGRIEPPRYGPPAPFQVPFLPLAFQPRKPPQYYGEPHPPYMSPPRRFHPNMFAALRFSRRISVTLHQLEVSGAGPFWITATDIVASKGNN